MKTIPASRVAHAALPRALFFLALTWLALASAGAIAADASKAQQPFEPDVADNQAVAIFAGGCFWCVEEAFDAVDGVVSTTSGYTGGNVDDPSYEQVSKEDTGHAEAVKVVYRPEQVGYDTLLDVFWHNIDPTDDGGQFCDRGDSYRSGIFAVTDDQRQAARASKQALQDDSDAPSPIVTRIVPATTFYPAEDYHQNYYKKNPLRYKFYRFSCGRDATLEDVWGDAAPEH